MRNLVLTKLSFISRRIHRAFASDEDSEYLLSPPSDVEIDWKWEDAEQRLGEAMDKGGAYAWAETALREMELEAAKTRRERELDEQKS